MLAWPLRRRARFESSKAIRSPKVDRGAARVSPNDTCRFFSAPSYAHQKAGKPCGLGKEVRLIRWRRLFGNAGFHRSFLAEIKRRDRVAVSAIGSVSFRRAASTVPRGVRYGRADASFHPTDDHDGAAGTAPARWAGRSVSSAEKRGLGAAWIAVGVGMGERTNDRPVGFFRKRSEEMTTQTLDMLDDLETLVDDLEQAQEELRTLYAQKREALRSARSDRLAKLINPERVLVHRLRELVKQRQRLLQQAERRGWAAPSLERLADQLVSPAGSANERARHLKTRIRALQQTAVRLRAESWVQWIVARRAFQHQTELLELIARGGGAEPIYQDQGETQVPGEGGALLDHAV